MGFVSEFYSGHASDCMIFCVILNSVTNKRKLPFDVAKKKKLEMKFHFRHHNISNKVTIKVYIFYFIDGVPFPTDSKLNWNRPPAGHTLFVHNIKKNISLKCKSISFVFFFSSEKTFSGISIFAVSMQIKMFIFFVIKSLFAVVQLCTANFKTMRNAKETIFFLRTSTLFHLTS